MYVCKYVIIIIIIIIGTVSGRYQEHYKRAILRLPHGLGF